MRTRRGQMTGFITIITTHWNKSLRDDQLNDSGDKCGFVCYNVHELKTCRSVENLEQMNEDERESDEHSPIPPPDAACHRITELAVVVLPCPSSVTCSTHSRPSLSVCLWKQQQATRLRRITVKLFSIDCFFPWEVGRARR